MNKPLITILILCIIIMFTACTPKKQQATQGISPYFDDKIKIELISIDQGPSGTSYGITLTNKSDQTIVQNNIYISYPITNKDKSQRTTNKCKVEFTGNKLNIKPNEQVTLTAFYP